MKHFLAFAWSATALLAPATAKDTISFSQAFADLTPLQAPTDTTRENPEGLDGRVMSGYQGWFRAEGDGSSLKFSHYSKGGKFEPGHCTIDLWPDLSEYDDDEKFPTPFRHADGSVAHVFSSLHAKTVDRHFLWMQQYGIDGAFIQRFASVVTSSPHSYERLKADNRKLKLCRDAANANDRAYALMYDLSGWKSDRFEILARDWKQLRTRMGLTLDANDRSYLQFDGKPLVAIWGVGFSDDREYDLDDAERFIRLLKHNPEWGGCSIMLGVPYYWRELDRDAVSAPKLLKVLQLADVISPWAVGRYHEVDFAKGKLIEHQNADLAWCRKHGIHYLPVIYPGFSWHNMHPEQPLASIPRRGGKFYWDQFVAARAAGNRSAYLAMFDEIDEATAIFKCTNNPPTGEGVTFLDYEGLPSDHYLKLSGAGGRLLRGEVPE